MPAKGSSASKCAPPSVENTGITGSANPAAGMPPLEFATSKYSKIAVVGYQARMWKRDATVSAMNVPGNRSWANAAVDPTPETDSVVLATRAVGTIVPFTPAVE